MDDGSFISYPVPLHAGKSLPGPPAPAYGPFSGQPPLPSRAASAAGLPPAPESAALGISLIPPGPVGSAPSSLGSVTVSQLGPIGSKERGMAGLPSPLRSGCSGELAPVWDADLTSAISLSRAFRSLSQSASRFSHTCFASSLSGREGRGRKADRPLLNRAAFTNCLESCEEPGSPLALVSALRCSASYLRRQGFVNFGITREVLVFGVCPSICTQVRVWKSGDENRRYCHPRNILGVCSPSV